ncbi:hypothetical protein [Paraburkholderia youngii]|uniref:hypothetical protein n=1 Tax=Paraburkholderia youngii TaxID=2782701 RepID=UPI003D1DF037
MKQFSLQGKNFHIVAVVGIVLIVAFFVLSHHRLSSDAPWYCTPTHKAETLGADGAVIEPASTILSCHHDRRGPSDVPVTVKSAPAKQGEAL